jgi:hypothetical protein
MVNQAVAKLGHKEKLVKGKGYYYWVGGRATRFKTSGVYVFRLNQLTLKQWVDDLKDKIKDSK